MARISVHRLKVCGQQVADTSARRIADEGRERRVDGRNRSGVVTSRLRASVVLLRCHHHPASDLSSQPLRCPSVDLALWLAASAYQVPPSDKKKGSCLPGWAVWHDAGRVGKLPWSWLSLAGTSCGLNCSLLLKEDNGSKEQLPRRWILKRLDRPFAPPVSCRRRRAFRLIPRPRSLLTHRTRPMWTRWSSTYSRFAHARNMFLRPTKLDFHQELGKLDMRVYKYVPSPSTALSVPVRSGGCLSKRLGFLSLTLHPPDLFPLTPDAARQSWRSPRRRASLFTARWADGHCHSFHQPMPHAPGQGERREEVTRVVFTVWYVCTGSPTLNTNVRCSTR
jgi:hypothetical protein